MSIEKKFHKLIQSHGREERDAILADIYARMPELAPKSKPAKKFAKRNMWFAIGTPVAAALCLAVVLPCVLIDDKPQTGFPNASYKYAQGTDYSIKNHDAVTINNYNAQYGTDIKMFDLYAYAENVVTVNFVHNKTSEVLGIQEEIIPDGATEKITLAATKQNVYLDSLENAFASCSSLYSIGNTEIKWNNDGNVLEELRGVFEYAGYRYYITLEWNNDENRLFELVAELLD